MRAPITRWTVALLVALLPAAAAAQEQNNPFLDLPIEQLAGTWLLLNCGVDDEPLLEVAVARNAEELVPRFLTAWQEGPPEEVRQRARRQAELRYRRSREALEDAESLGLSSEQVAVAAEQTQEKYVGRALESLDATYRSQALRGILLFGGTEGVELAREVAGDEESPYAATARALLKRREEPRTDG